MLPSVIPHASFFSTRGHYYYDLVDDYYYVKLLYFMESRVYPGKCLLLFPQLSLFPSLLLRISFKWCDVDEQVCRNNNVVCEPRSAVPKNVISTSLFLCPLNVVYEKWRKKNHILPHRHHLHHRRGSAQISFFTWVLPKARKYIFFTWRRLFAWKKKKKKSVKSSGNNFPEWNLVGKGD